MHLHYFQHDYFEDLGFIGEWASQNGFTTSATRFDINPQLPNHESYDWLVVMGGKMSVNDSDKYPWLIEEIAFIKQAIEFGKVVIGICLGSQLLARALGSDVFRNKVPEMGFLPVQFNENARMDKVFQHFPESLTVLHVHFDTFNLPAGAINMAKSDATQCQAFRKGETVFAFQFHFEVTPENVKDFISEVSPEIVDGPFSQTPTEMLKLAGCCLDNNTIFRKVLDEIPITTNKKP